MSIESKQDPTTIIWKVGDSIPSEFPPNPFLSCFIPRPTAWLNVFAEDGGSCQVALLQGYNGASDHPPAIMFSSKALPPCVLRSLLKHKRCSLSLATTSEKDSLLKAAAPTPMKNHGPALSLEELGFTPAPIPSSLIEFDKQKGIENTLDIRPPAIDESPVQLYCMLSGRVSLDPADDADTRTDCFDMDYDKDTMLILEFEHFVFKKHTLVQQENVVNPAKDVFCDNVDLRRILAKIDARLIKPVVSLGNNVSGKPRFGHLRDNDVHHMYRPIYDRKESEWIVDTFRKAPKIEPHLLNTFSQDIEFNYASEPYCRLGYNPTKQIVMPRPIGWLSSYSTLGVPHIAPYSFFSDVARSYPHMMCVAFIACRLDGGNIGGINSFKDAHRDAEEGGEFAWNMVTEEYAYEMNYSAAPMPSEESEFEAASLEYVDSLDSTTCGSGGGVIKAPIVKHSPVVLECKYVKTVVIPKRLGPSKERDWFCIIGRVVAIRIQSHILQSGPNGSAIDMNKLYPVTRLGYLQEYGVISDLEWE